MKIPTAQYIARKTLRDNHYEEYREILAALKEADKNSKPVGRVASNKWHSGLAQKAIREITIKYADEYRTARKKAVAEGYRTSHV